MDIGVVLQTTPPSARVVDLATRAETFGFSHVWTFDSHILWQESYATLPVAASRTQKVKLGHFVTNPGIRDPSVNPSFSV